jgi:hypothetical protein
MSIRTDIIHKMFKVGQHVRYIPYHADDDPSHPDCENGVITSVRTHSPVDGMELEEPIIFVRFRGETSQGCKIDQLR